MSRSPSPVLQALREATRESHERLDSLFGRFDLGSATEYQAFLTAHAMALPPLEAELGTAGLAAALDDWPQRLRSDALAADLHALGTAMPPPLAPVPIATLPAAWGTAYVLEGSRLGGAMLSRQIAGELPRSYLGTPQAPGAWRKFLETLAGAVYRNDDMAAAGAAAADAFALFERAGRMMLERRLA